MASCSDKTSDSQKSDKDQDEIEKEGKRLGQKKVPRQNSRNKSKRAHEQTETKKKSWVWKHFAVVQKPLMSRNEEGIMVQVGLTNRAQCRQAFDRLAEEEDTKYKSYFDEDDEENEEEGEDVGTVGRGKKVGPPTDDDWEKAVAFVKFLRVFFDVTLNVSASSKPTAHKAFHDIVSIKCEIEEIFDAPITNHSTDYEKTLFNMSVQMRSKYNKYFDSLDDVNQLLVVALVLDPRFKLRYFTKVLERMLNYDAFTIKMKTERLKELIVTLTDLYASMNGVQNSSTKRIDGVETGTESGSSCSSKKLTGKKAKMMEDWKKDLEDVDAVVVAHEVDRYLLDPIEKPGPGIEFDILSWWRIMGGKYPNLQALAKDVLAIQVSTVASESSFSTGKRVIDPHRSSLTPRSVEALICLQSWLKSDTITTLAYTPTPDEIEWLEKTEQEHFIFLFIFKLKSNPPSFTIKFGHHLVAPASPRRLSSGDLHIGAPSSHHHQAAFTNPQPPHTATTDLATRHHVHVGSSPFTTRSVVVRPSPSVRVQTFTPFNSHHIYTSSTAPFEQPASRSSHPRPYEPLSTAHVLTLANPLSQAHDQAILVQIRARASRSVRASTKTIPAASDLSYST
ncbi:Unknown protein [Striga hermonthica]|uniref:Transposase n=1 Tax=Striga hermonthica TaxID=68872 RepID=A0A9N7NKV8_STRHE|nr:Unknown protein [Striga hermonthica]